MFKQRGQSKSSAPDNEYLLDLPADLPQRGGSLAADGVDGEHDLAYRMDSLTASSPVKEVKGAFIG